MGEGGDGPALAVVADDADVVVLGHGVLYLPQGEMYLLPCDADFQLRFGPEEHPPQLVGQLEELFFPVGLEQIIEGVDGEFVPYVFRGRGHEHQQQVGVGPAQDARRLDAIGAFHADVEKNDLMIF